MSPQQKHEFPSFLALLISAWVCVLAVSCNNSLNSIDSLLKASRKKASDPRPILAYYAAGAVSYPGESASVTQSVGPGGGTLTTASGTASLEIPAGALSTGVQITMTVEGLGSGDVSGFQPTSGRVRLQPEGTRFEKPVILRLKYGRNGASLTAMQEEMTAVYYTNEATGQQELLPTTKSEGTVIAELQHFSRYSALYLRVEDVVAGTITDTATIQSTAIQFRNYLRGMTRASQRNYFYDLYQPTLLPFLIIVNRVYPVGANPLMLQFPTDDFDQDGVRNNIDPFPFDPTNSADTTPPTVTAVSPTGSAVPLNPGQVVVTFSEPVSEPTLRFAASISDGASTYPLTFVSLDASRRIARYSYGYWLGSGTTYNVSISGATDAVYNQMAPNPAAGSFTTEDRVLPTIQAYTPSGVNAPLSTSQVTLMFSEAVNPATLGGVRLIGPGNPGLSFAAISADGKTATFNVGMALADGGTYFIDPGAGITDISGNALAVGPGFLFFQMEDHTPPMAYVTSPSASTLVNPDSPGDIVVVFSEAVDPAAINGIVSLVGGSVNNPTVRFVSIDDFHQRATYHIDGPLDQETHYRVDLAPGYADEAGNTQTVRASFQMQTADTIPPTVASITPADGANRVSYWTPLSVRVRFSEPMDQASLASGMTITDTLGNPVPVTFVSYTPGLEEALYTVSAGDLSAYTGYTISLAAGVADDSANPLGGARSFSFFTDLASNPRVTAVQLSRCSGTGPYQVRLDFDRTMDFAATGSGQLGVQLEKDYTYTWNRKQYIQTGTHQDPNWAKLTCYREAGNLWNAGNILGAIWLKLQCDPWPDTIPVADYGYVTDTYTTTNRTAAAVAVAQADVNGSAFAYGPVAESTPLWVYLRPASRCNIIEQSMANCNCNKAWGCFFDYPSGCFPPVGTACYYDNPTWNGYTQFHVQPKSGSPPVALDWNQRGATVAPTVLAPASLGQACY